MSIYCRLIGQGAALAIHSANSAVMLLSMQNEELMKDPEINTMTSLQNRYLTIWNVGFQISYFSLAFMCDILTVTGRDHAIPKSIRNLRQTFFASIVWPLAVIIFMVFWSFFLTNRTLLYPEFIDKIFSFKSNLVMHFFILPAVVWELLFMARPLPKSHAKNIGIATVLDISYVACIIHLYNQDGHWPYPILYKIYGTIYFPMFIAIVYMLGLWIYFLQWKLTSMIWGNEIKNPVKRQ